MNVYVSTLTLMLILWIMVTITITINYSIIINGKRKKKIVKRVIKIKWI